MHEDMQEHQRRAGRIETLIQEIDEFSDEHTRSVTGELVRSLLDMYGEGLARIFTIIAQTEASNNKLIETLANDDLVSALLMLHGLHPIDIETRIVQALDEIRPSLKAHGGNVEFIRVEDNVAYLRLEGSCHGCSSSTATLKLTIEEAIYKAAPDLDRLEVEGVADPPRQAIPVMFIPSRRQKNGANTSSGDNTALSTQAG